MSYPKKQINSSCETYEKIEHRRQIKYTRNETKFCRSASNSDKDYYSLCKKLVNDKEKQEQLSLLFNVPWNQLCGYLYKMKTGNMALEVSQVKYIATHLKISVKKKNIEELYDKIHSAAIEGFQEWFRSLVHDVDDKKWVVYILYKMFIPYKTTEKTDMKISNEMYDQYLKLLSQEDENVIQNFLDETYDYDDLHFKHLSRIEREQLRDSLVRKFQHCVHKFRFRNQIYKFVLKPEFTDKKKIISYDPYELCNNVVLTRRRIKAPENLKKIIGGGKNIGRDVDVTDVFKSALLQTDTLEDFEIMSRVASMYGGNVKDEEIESHKNDIQNEKKVIRAASNSSNGFSFEHASDTLKRDKNFVLKDILPNNPHTLRYMDKSLRDDPEVVAFAVSKEPSTLQWASIRLKYNKTFLLYLLDIVPDTKSLYKFIGHKMRKDPDVTAKALVLEPKVKKWVTQGQ